MTDILIPKKNIILDATTLSTFMSCARLTDLRMNLQLQPIGGKSASLEKGSLVHIILEHFYKAQISGKTRIEAIDEGLKAGVVYLEEVDNLEQEDITLVNNTIEAYFEFYKNDSWIPIFAEYVKQDIIYEDDEIRILWKAKLDLGVDTNNGIYPVDHKTMSQRRDTNSLNNQFMGQCLMMKSRGVIINKIGFQKSLKPSDKFTRPIISYSADRLTEWSQVILPFWAKQMLVYNEIGFWPPNFTHCENKYGFCIFKPVCEADSGLRQETLRLNFVKGDRWDVTNDAE
jgi:hypothetical protein